MWLSRLDFPLAAVVIVIVAVGCFPACLVVPRLIGQTNSKPPRLSQLVQTQNIACRARLWHTVATRVRLVFFSNVPGGSSRACHGCPAQKLFRVNPNCRGGCRCWGGRISPQFNICTKLIDHVTLGGRGGSEYLAANFNQQPEKYSAEKSTSFDGMMDISVWPVD